MKILFINTKPDLSWYTKRGLNIEATFVDIVLPKLPVALVSEKPNGNNVMTKFYAPWAEQVLAFKFQAYEYSAIVVGYNPSEYGNELSTTGGYSHWKALPCGTFWSVARKDGYENHYIKHELMHVIGNIINTKLGDITPKDYMDATPVNGIMQPYFKDNDPESVDGNFAFTWNLYKPFVDRLNKLDVVTPTQSGVWPNFNPKSDPKMVGIKPAVMDVLQTVRTMVGFGVSISSGFRTVADNKRVKGAPNSAHLKGLAADIPCTDPAKRTALIRAFLTCGTPLFLEITPKHLHIDLDSSIHPLGNTIVII